MIRDIKFNQDAQESILKGIKTTVDAVKVTLGPKGNFVIINDLNNKPKVTKDGVTVVKSIELADPYENIGASLIKEAADKTLSTVGDATTTSSILTYAIINAGLKEIKQGRNPVKLIKGINLAIDSVLEYIKNQTKEIKDEDITSIATISANNDAEIGKLIGDAFKLIGREGVITLEESQSLDTTIKTINGLHFDKGYVSPHFITDAIKETCVLENPRILITDHKIIRLRDIKKLLEYVVMENRPIVLLAEEFDDEVLETLKYNKLQGTLKVCAVKAPSFGKYREALLEDIAISTNGTFISYDSGMELSDALPEHLGVCSKIIVEKNSTTIIGTPGNVDDRISLLKKQLQDVKDAPEMDGSFMIDFLNKRIAMLSGGIASIYVGGKTELELQERKDRIDDAICATRAAIESGILPGGGIVYYNASKKLEIPSDDPDIIAGFKVIKEALLEPIYILLENAGINPLDIVSNITESNGYNVNKEEFADMLQAGIIDPAKAVTFALTNSASVASLFLGTRCVIVPKFPNNILT